MADEPVKQSEIADAVAAAARQREIDARWEAHLLAHDQHNAAHALEHTHEKETTRLREEALGVASKVHDGIHESERKSVATALAQVERLADVHSEAHKREHLAHEQRHDDQTEAVTKAEISVDKRLEAMNQIREQLREQAAAFAPAESLALLQRELDRRFADTTKHTDERYEENRRRIEAIEKGDVKQEGKSLGQGATVAIIVGAVSLVGTVLGIVIVLSNFATGQ